MLTARASAALLWLSKSARRRSVDAGKDLFLSLPHRRLRARVVIGMVVADDVKRSVNHQPSELFTDWHTRPLRILSRDVGADVDVADCWSAAGFSAHSERNNVGRAV